MNIIYRSNVRGFKSWALLMLAALAQVIEGVFIIATMGALGFDISEKVETLYLESAMKGLTVKKDEQ